ncbi:hypothetical protein [Phenylobacterium sp.]|uniref:hypothetical protein n=1 Tax=Phenylobacterium sp. TaxID=1871053 RepID=UPI002E331B3B|nr:hypothetical protein [Phenylobacterium sp.]HEX3366103.1 hypothetical protein [Phenylobacterium sp.]
MSVLGRWRIVAMPDCTDDYPDVMEPFGEGWAELQSNRALKGQICFHGGDDTNFIARRETSSTAC